MQDHSHQPADKNGSPVSVGDIVRIIGLSGDWFDQLPGDERTDVESMIGEIFPIEEIDKYGHPWVRKSWSDESEGTCRSHSIALEPSEMERQPSLGTQPHATLVKHREK